jgi:carbon storage regulator
MLVLSRRRGESLKLGDDIEITILRAATGQVSLGIVAPRTLPVLRGELAAALSSGNLAALQFLPEKEVLVNLGSAKKEDLS